MSAQCLALGQIENIWNMSGAPRVAIPFSTGSAENGAIAAPQLEQSRRYLPEGAYLINASHRFGSLSGKSASFSQYRQTYFMITSGTLSNFI